jgi:hypothetical protein
MQDDCREEMYKVRAAACLEIARTTNDRDSKIALFDMAREWLVLVQQHRQKHSNIGGL